MRFHIKSHVYTDCVTCAHFFPKANAFKKSENELQKLLFQSLRLKKVVLSVRMILNPNKSIRIAFRLQTDSDL